MQNEYIWYLFGDPCSHFQASFTCCERSCKRVERPARILTDCDIQFLPFLTRIESSSAGIVEVNRRTPLRTQQLAALAMKAFFKPKLGC